MPEWIMRVVRARIDDDNNDDQGFTLVELLIVVIVLGILAAVTVFGLSGATKQSAQAACNADAKSVEVAVEAFRANTGNYPTQQTDLTTNISGQVYLRIWPNSPHYQINLVANTGEVDVGAPTGPPWTNYDTTPNNPCTNVS